MPKRQNKPTPQASAKSAALRAEYGARKAEADARAAAWRKIENSYKGGVPNRASEGWSKSNAYRFNTSGERANVLSARDRAYEAYDTNPVAQTLIETESANVIGDGLNYQPTTSSPEFNDEAKEKYYEWLSEASVRGPDMDDGCSLERTLWEQSRVAGDVAWVLVSRGNDSYIQMLRSEQIVTPDGMWSDPAVFDGIRYDPWGKPLVYYVLDESERTARKFIPIPARDVVFLPHFTKPNQSRGVTAFMRIFNRLSALERYIDGVELAAWMATVFGLIFKQQNGAKEVAALPSLTDSQGTQRAAITLEGPMVKYVGRDDEVVQVDAKQPQQHTPEFIVNLMRLIGQPFDMPLAILFKDTSRENFASARIGLLPFYRSCRIKAARFASRWSRTIGWWLSRERLRGPDDRKKWKTAFPEDYRKHDLLVNAWSYTDPVSEAQADLLEMDMKTKSPQMVMEERGRDPRKVQKDWEAWQQLMGSFPQVRSSLTRDPTPEQPEPPDSPDTVSGDQGGDYPAT